VSETGFYYFIFANENEITDNFLSARFDMRKTVFDVGQSQQNCTNATSCQFPLQFWSKEHVVLEIPDEEEEEDATASKAPCEAIVGFSSLQECHRVVVAESLCHPRKVVYMSFLLLAPVLILVFAYI